MTALAPTSAARRNDQGSILPLVLIVAVVLSLVVVALAKFVTTDLIYAGVTEDRAERQATATSAISYGVERIRLGQSECASSAGGFGPLTPGVLDRNGATTTLSCSRFASGLSDITGWAVIMTGNGVAADLLLVKGGGNKKVTGPMFITDVTDVAFQGGGTSLEQLDGDLWHNRSTCPGPAVTLPSAYTFNPSNARGALCTTQIWSDKVAQPVIPNLSTLPVNNGTIFTTDTTTGSCRVFAPGRYTGTASLGSGDVYFQSGNYYFDNVGPITVKQQIVWFGNPGGDTPVIANPNCVGARNADPNIGGVGAIAYLGGNSKINMDTQGSMELFGKLVGEYEVSLQQLESTSGYTTSTATAASGTDLVLAGPGSTIDLVFRGMVYAPNGRFNFDNSSNSATQQLLGGAVVSQMWIQASASATGFRISVATTPAETNIVLTATSSTTRGSTSVQAIVEYRRDEPDPTKRVAVNSLRVLD